MWKAPARELYIKGEKVNEIAKVIGKSRRTLSEYFKDLPLSYHEQRNDAKKERRRSYQRNWDKNERVRTEDMVYVSVQRQHDIDARVLSAERHFH